MHQLPAILRFLLGRFGMFSAIAITTMILMAVSVALTSALMFLFDLSNLKVGVALAAFCPLVVTPVVVGFYLRMIEKLEHANRQLEAALSEVKEFKGLLPICSGCKKIRDDEGYWNHIEGYISARSRAEFSHGICPDCMEALYGEYLR